MQGGNSPLSKDLSLSGGTGMAQKPVAQHTFLRGRTLLEQRDFESTLNSVRPQWDGGIQIGPFCMSSDDATKHVALIGAPGSGKTVLMRLMMQSVLPLIGKDWKGQVSESEAKKIQSAAIAAAIQKRKEDLQPVTFRSGESTPRPATVPRVGCRGAVEKLLYLWLIGLIIAVVVTVVSIPLSWEPGLLAIPYTMMSGVVLMGLFKLADWLDQQPTKSAIVPARSVVSNPEPVTAPVAPGYDGPFTWEKHRALVYDAKLEVIPQLSGMALQAPTIIFNPFDKRSVAWDMALDITEPATAKQIASIFIPDEKKASQPFFSDAARQLLEGVMVAFILTRPKQWTLRDVLIALKSGTRLTAVLSSTSVTKDLVETYLSNERETKSIIATIATKLGPFDVVAALWDSAESKMSLREWLDSESILVLGNDEAYRSSLDVINQVIFKRIVELLLAQPETTLGRTWFFLDEVKEAGNLDALGRLMTKGRSVGASVVLGFQDVDGMYEAFGENQAKSILGQCATKLFLRLDSPETAKWAESVFGEYEAVEVKQSASLGESTSEGTSTTKGTSSTDSTNSGKSSTWSGLDHSSGKNSGTSESHSTSESTSQSSTTGQNRSVTQAADIAKRNVILAAQFQSLPMTSKASGVNGFIAHHLGATSFHFMGFERMLRPSDSSSPRVLYRDGSEQFLKPWTPQEESEFVPPADSAPSEDAPSGSIILDAQARYKRGRFLPGTDAENGLRRRGS